MAKLKNVTEAELIAAQDAAFEAAQTAGDLHRRASQGYCDDLREPLALASAFASASRALAELSAFCLMKAALDEQRRETEREIRSRVAT